MLFPEEEGSVLVSIDFELLLLKVLLWHDIRVVFPVPEWSGFVAYVLWVLVFHFRPPIHVACSLMQD